jgi:hypothetical protein
VPSPLTPRTDEQADDRGEDYGRWSLSDRLLVLAFELRLAGWPVTEVSVLYDAADIFTRSTTHCSHFGPGTSSGPLTQGLMSWEAVGLLDLLEGLESGQLPVLNSAKESMSFD